MGSITPTSFLGSKSCKVYRTWLLPQSQFEYTCANTRRICMLYKGLHVIKTSNMQLNTHSSSITIQVTASAIHSCVPLTYFMATWQWSWQVQFLTAQQNTLLLMAIIVVNPEKHVSTNCSSTIDAFGFKMTWTLRLHLHASRCLFIFSPHNLQSSVL